MRFALGLEYDGSGFPGWQTQPSGLAIQNIVEAAISRVADHPVQVITAGRTDAGVHATGQVIHFDSDANRPDSAWVRGVNTNLPATIRVRWASPIQPEFHARFSAKTRTYRYWLFASSTASAVLAGRIGWFHEPLQLAAMQRAALALIGEHDFSAFRASGCQAKSPVRNLQALNVTQHGHCFCFELKANAFLYHMVRNIVGCLVYVGAGREQDTWLAEVLESRSRVRASPTFMPDGLYLTHVEYERKFEIPNAPTSAFMVG